MKKKSEENYSEKEALERMNKALKGAMKEPPKPHKDMAKGRRRSATKPEHSDG